MKVGEMTQWGKWPDTVFNPPAPHGKRREQASEICLLTAHAPWCLHTDM